MFSSIRVTNIMLNRAWYIVRETSRAQEALVLQMPGYLSKKSMWSRWARLRNWSG